jgi:phosphinothricin acetyltransferase
MTGLLAPSIRLATTSDAAAIAAIYRPAVADSAISFEIEPPDAAEMDRRVQATLLRTPWIVCEYEQSIVGYAYAGRHRERPAYQWSVEVSAYVAGERRRSGAATALYTSLFAVLALQGFRSAYAGITLPNPASVGLHQRVGFTRVGVFRNIGYKHGAWHDVEWLERQLAPHVAEPDVPTPLSDLRGRPELDAAMATGFSHLHLHPSRVATAAAADASARDRERH